MGYRQQIIKAQNSLHPAAMSCRGFKPPAGMRTEKTSSHFDNLVASRYLPAMLQSMVRATCSSAATCLGVLAGARLGGGGAAAGPPHGLDLLQGLALGLRHWRGGG